MKRFDDPEHKYLGLVPQYYSDSESDDSESPVVINDAWLNEGDISHEEKLPGTPKVEPGTESFEANNEQSIGDAFNALCAETLCDFEFDQKLFENLDLPIDNTEIGLGEETEKALEALLKESDLAHQDKELDLEEWNRIWSEINDLNEQILPENNVLNAETVIKTEPNDDDLIFLEQGDTYTELENVDFSNLLCDEHEGSIKLSQNIKDEQHGNTGEKRKRQLSSSDDDEIVVKQFCPNANSDFFRTETGSEFSVNPTSSENSSNDDSLEREVTRSVLHILTAPYFDLKYPDDKRAIFIMSKACDQLVKLTSELHTMYRHIVRNRSSLYMKTVRRNIRRTLIELLADMLITKSSDYDDMISTTRIFEDCFQQVFEDQKFELPMNHTESEKDLESYRQLICDRAIITSSIEINATKIMSSISPVVIHNDIVVTTYVYLLNLMQEKYKSKLATQVRHYLFHSLHIPYN